MGVLRMLLYTLSLRSFSSTTSLVMLGAMTMKLSTMMKERLYIRT